MTRWLPGLCALLAPLGVLLASAGWLVSPSAPADASPEAPGTGIATPSAIATLDASLRADPPDVVVLGNSKVDFDLDLPAIREELLPDGGSLAAIRNNGSAAPTWYAALDGRVFKQDLRPRLVVVYGPIDQMLRTEATSRLEVGSLSANLGEGTNAVVERVSFGRNGSSPFTALADRAVRARETISQTLFDSIRDLAVHLATGNDGTEARAALDRLLGDGGAFRRADRARILPVQEQETAAAASPVSGPESSFLPELVRLAHGNGARIVFVRAPLSPAHRAEKTGDDDVSAAITLLGRLGAGWIDLSGLRLAGSMWKDDVHLAPAGREALTARLLVELERFDPLGPDPMPVAHPPAGLLGARRIGAPVLPDFSPVAKEAGGPCAFTASLPAFAALTDEALLEAGLGATSPLRVLERGETLMPHARPKELAGACSASSGHHGRTVQFSASTAGRSPVDFALALPAELPVDAGSASEAWWVYPGTRAVLRIGALPAGGRVIVALRRVGPGAGEPTVETAGKALALVAGEGIGADDRDGEIEVGALDGPWELSITVPPDGPFVRIERIGLRDGLPAAGEGGVDDPVETRWIVGSRAERVSLLPSRPRMPEPGPVRAGAPEPDGAALRYPVALAALADDARMADGSQHGCSPLRLAVGNRLLARRVQDANAVRGGMERTAHLGDFFWTPARFNDADVEQTGRIVLDPLRICGSSLWLYPKDRLERKASLPDLAGLRHGATHLALRAREIRRATDDASIGGPRIQIFAGRSAVLDEIAPYVALGGELRFPLYRTLAGAQRLRLVVENDGPEAVILDSIELVRR